MNAQSCSTIWWAAATGAPNRVATAAADRKQAWKARLRATRSRPMASWARSTAGRGRHDPRRLPDERAEEQPRPDALAR